MSQTTCLPSHTTHEVSLRSGSRDTERRGTVVRLEAPGLPVSGDLGGLRSVGTPRPVSLGRVVGPTRFASDEVCRRRVSSRERSNVGTNEVSQGI